MVGYSQDAAIAEFVQSERRQQIEELRRLLLAPYMQELAQLRAQMGELAELVEAQQTLLENLEPRINAAVGQMLRESRDEMSAAIAPLLGPAIKTQITTAREDIIDALYPVIGSTITKSISEAVRGLVETIDQNVKRTFSFAGLKRKVKAKATGMSEGALALRESLPFSVTEIFLIHSETGLLISHISATNKLADGQMSSEEASQGDRELVSGMLTAIRDFVKESFREQTGVTEYSQLNQIQYGGLTILIEPSRYAYLAVVFAGVAPTNFPARIREILGWIHGGYTRQLRAFGETGDPSQLVKVRDLLYNLVIKST